MSEPLDFSSPYAAVKEAAELRKQLRDAQHACEVQADAIFELKRQLDACQERHNELLKSMMRAGKDPK